MTDIGYSLGDAFGSVIISTNVGQAMQDAQRQFDSGLSAMSASIKSWGDSLTQMGAQMSVLSTPLRSVISTGLEVVADFDDIMSSIEGRTGASADEMERIRAFAREQGAATVFSSQQVGEALLGLMTSGMSVEQAMATLPSVLQAATADSAELGATADIVTNIMASFGLEAANSQEIVDALARASGASKASISSLGQGFGNVGGMAKQFGLDVEETAAILAIFSNNGIQGAEAGTQLRSMLNHMMSDAAPTTAAWNKLGVSLYDANGNMRDLNTVMQELDRALDALPVEEQNRLMQDLAGSYGILGFTALRSSMSIEEMQGVMAGQADAASIAEQMMGTLRNMINSLMGSWETLLEVALAPTVEEYLKPIINTLIELVNGMAAWAQQNPDLTQTIVILGAAIATLGPVLVGIGLAVSVAGGALALLLSPITLISGAVFALAVVFRDQLSSIIAAVTAFVQEASLPFNNFISKINQVVAHFNFLLNSGTEFFDALRSEIGFFSDSILGFFGITGEAADNIQSTLISMVTSLETLVGNVQTIIRVSIDSFTSMSASGASLFTMLRNQVNVLTPLITGFLGITGETADSIQVWLWNAVTNVETLLGVAQGFLNDFMSTLSLVADRTGALIGNFVRLLSSGMGIFDALRSEVRYFAGTLFRYFDVSKEASNQLRDVLVGALNILEASFIGAGTIVEGVISTLIQFGTQTVAALGSIGPFLSSLGTGLATLARYVVESVDAFTSLRSQGMDVFDTLQTMIRFNLRGFLEFMGITGEAATHVQNVLDGVVANLEVFWDTLSAATPDGFVSDILAASGAAALFESALASLQGIIESMQAGFETLSTALSGMRMSFNFLRSIGYSSFGAIAEMIDTFGGSALNMVGITGDLADSIKEWLSAAVLNIERLFNAAGSVVSSVWNWLSGLGETISGIDMSGLSQFIQPLYDIVMWIWSLTNPLYLAWQILATSGIDFIQVIEDVAAGLTTFFDTLSNGGSLTDAFSAVFGPEMVNNIQGGIQTVMRGVRSLIDLLVNIWDDVRPGLEALGSWFIYDVLPAIGTLITDGIIPAFESLVGFLSDLWDIVSPSLAAFGEWFTTTISGVAIPAITDFIQILTGIWDTVSPALLQLADWFLNDAMPAIVGVVNDSLMPAFQSIADFLTQLWDMVSPYLQSFSDWFLTTALPAIQQFITGTVIPAIGDLIDVVTRVWNDVSPFLLQFADWFLTSVLPTIVSYIEGLVIPGIQKFIDILVSIWETISPTLEQLYNWFITDGLPLILDVLEVGRQAVQALIDIMVGIWNAVQPGLQFLQDGLNTLITWLIDNIFTPLGNLIADVVTGFVNIWNDITTGIENLKNGLLAVVTWFDTTIVQPIKNLIDTIVNGFKGIWDAVQVPLNTLKNGIQGVLDGITTAINNVMTALGIAQQEKQVLTQEADRNIMYGAGPSKYDMWVSAGGDPDKFPGNKPSAPPIVLGSGGMGDQYAKPYVGSFATGTDYIKQSGMAEVHEGEAILTKEQNAARREGITIQVTIENLHASGAAEGQAAGDALGKSLEERFRFSGGSFSGN